jgi:hypothetical protein
MVALGLASYAQSVPNRLVVTMKNGDVTVYNIADVDSLSFDLIDGEVAAYPEFKSFEWDELGFGTVNITLSDAAQSYKMAIVPVDYPDVEGVLAEVQMSQAEGDLVFVLGDPTPGDTYMIVTVAYDKYGIAGEMLTTTFVIPEKPTTQTALSIAIPTNFNSCWVQRVMHNGVKVAEVCKEYIKEFDDQRIVVYPCDENGNAIQTKGVSANDGGTVVWDEEANTVTYTPGNSTALSMVYLVDGEIVLTAPESVEPTDVEADLLVDVRGSEEEVYKIVKIGTQYWLAENLRTQKWDADLTLNDIDWQLDSSLIVTDEAHATLHSAPWLTCIMVENEDNYAHLNSPMGMMQLAEKFGHTADEFKRQYNER